MVLNDTVAPATSTFLYYFTESINNWSDTVNTNDLKSINEKLIQI